MEPIISSSLIVGDVVEPWNGYRTNGKRYTVTKLGRSGMGISDRLYHVTDGESEDIIHEVAMASGFRLITSERFRKREIHDVTMCLGGEIVECIDSKSTHFGKKFSIEYVNYVTFAIRDIESPDSRFSLPTKHLKKNFIWSQK